MGNMSSLILQCVQLIIILKCLSVQNGMALRVEAVPESLDGTSDIELNITCSVEDSSAVKKNILTIEIARKKQKPVALVMKGQMYSGPNMKPNMQAEGKITRDEDVRYLRLTIKNPRVEDSGTYVCRMLYLDPAVTITEVKAYKSVTMNALEPVATYLMNKVSKMEEKLKQQSHVISEQETKLKNLQEHIKESDSKGAYTVAFFAGFGQNDKVVSGENIVFSKGFVNIGNAYNFKTGVFTAPKTGLYLFYLSAGLMHKNARIFIDLRVNYKIKGGSVNAHTDTLWDMSSSNALVSLNAGEIVWPHVRLLTGTEVLVEDFSTFGGHLVKLL